MTETQTKFRQKTTGLAHFLWRPSLFLSSALLLAIALSLRRHRSSFAWTVSNDSLDGRRQSATTPCTGSSSKMVFCSASARSDHRPLIFQNGLSWGDDLRLAPQGCDPRSFSEKPRRMDLARRRDPSGRGALQPCPSELQPWPARTSFELACDFECLCDGLDASSRGIHADRIACTGSEHLAQVPGPRFDGSVPPRRRSTGAFACPSKTDLRSAWCMRDEVHINV